MKCKVIFNPVAGKGCAVSKINQIKSLFDGSKLDYDIVFTEAPGHAVELAAEAGRNDYNFIVSTGGDGTSSEVINGLMSIRETAKLPALAVLPIGSGNDFAYGINLLKGTPQILKLLVAGNTRHLDIGKITGGAYPKGRYFGNGIGIGFDTIVGLEAAKLKHIHGAMGYVVAAIKTLIMYPKFPFVTLQIGDEKIEQIATMISIMNGRRMGGTFYMAPESINDDGQFDLCMAGKLSRSEMLNLFLKFLKGTQAESRHITTRRYSRFQIESSQGGLVCHADGETICINGKSLLVECFPAALRVLKE
jgi:YegS/Rv2252/BmrU family lipid kinase